MSIHLNVSERAARGVGLGRPERRGPERCQQRHVQAGAGRRWDRRGAPFGTVNDVVVDGRP